MHIVSNEVVVKKCTEPAIEQFNEKHRDKLVRKPEYYFETIGNSGRSYKLRIFVSRRGSEESIQRSVSAVRNDYDLLGSSEGIAEKLVMN